MIQPRRRLVIQPTTQSKRITCQGRLKVGRGNLAGLCNAVRNCVPFRSEGILDVNHHQPNGQILTESDVALPLVMVPAPEYTKENESGSDIFSKREVIQKLRQQLKKRDDMILEMQDQIMELQNSLSSQLSHSSHLQVQLDAANRDLHDLPSEPRNGHANGYLNGDTNLESPEKGRGDSERIEMLRREVGELREVIEGKEYLLQSYKEQKVELSMKIKELQQRLDSQLPNIL
ncbi:hypothetical protein CK203_030403 [Vitis vinifera]|uniref:Uncharacterized protein n=1 Tax=Vitis vinifera TaxID=29760 RepID=A0A438IVY6_VITVI|nr:hypothetical protein CK203_030403 [Vitis vinifera]